MYEWLKIIHILSVISWMAMLLYLPRLFVYHSMTENGTPQSETFKIMERRLYRAIGTPAMISSWVAGLWIGWQFGFMKSGWFHAKILIMIIMTFIHFYLGMYVKLFSLDSNTQKTRFFRILNEIPTVLMIAGVVLVILKPF